MGDELRFITLFDDAENEFTPEQERLAEKAMVEAFQRKIKDSEKK